MILYGMLYAVAVGLPIFLAAAVSSRLLRRHGRAERGAWIAALILGLASPVIALTMPTAKPPATSVPFPVVETGLIGLPAAVAVPVPVASGALGLDEILIGLWLLTSLVLVVRWAVTATRLARLTRSCPVETVDGIRVSLTSDLGPAVAGWMRPRILVPAWLMSMPQPQRSLVLLHEEEHLRARDPLLILASRVACILAPWNPLVWLLSSRLLRAVELDCDRRVLRRRPDVEAYGTTLLTLSARDPGALLGAAAFAEAEAPLRRRILAMTTPPSTVSVLGLVTALVLGILLLLGAFEVPIPIFSLKPSYTAEGTLRIESASRQGSNDATSMRAERLPESTAWIELLRSYQVLEPVVVEQRLYLQASAEHAHGFASFTVAEQFVPGTYQLRVGDIGEAFVLVDGQGALIQQGAFESPVGQSMGFIWTPSRTSFSPGTTVEFSVVSVRDAARDLSRALMTAMDRDGSLMRLSLKGEDRQQTTDVLNALMERHVELATVLKRSKLEETLANVEEQLQTMELELEQAERDLEESRVGTISASSDQSLPVADRSIEDGRLRRRVITTASLYSEARGRVETARRAVANSIPDVRILDPASPSTFLRVVFGARDMR